MATPRGRRRTSDESPSETLARQQAAYARHAAQALQRIRSMSQAGRDIGDLPPIANRQRRVDSVYDFRRFCDSYFPHAFTLPWSDDHLRIIRKIQQAIVEGGLFAMAMPRGSGKTTLCEVACLFALLHGHREFVCLIGASETHAAEMLQSLRTELDTNDLLLADFPEVCYPIRMLEGIHNRARGQLYHGERTRIEFNAQEMVLPTIKPRGWQEDQSTCQFTRHNGYSLSSGSVIRVAGITGRIRGMKHKRADGRSIRPSLVLIDDPQTDEVARSQTQVAARERVLVGAVLGLAGPGTRISGIMPCTVIRPGDLADRILDQEKHPEWNGERTKLVYSFPANQELWKRYAEIRADSMRAGNNGREATEFYAANRAAMDAGAVVAWPARFNPDELSAVQHAMNLLIDRGEHAFYAEYQNEPLQDVDQPDLELEEDDILTRLNRRRRYEVPQAATHLTAFIDVHASLHYYMVCAWEPDCTAYIIDYGTYPEQPIGQFTLESAPVKLADRHARMGNDALVYAGLQALVQMLMGREWRREDGVGLTFDRILIDANWGPCTDLVYRFVSESGHASVIVPSHGKYVGAASRSFSEYQRRPGEIVGNNWRMPVGQNKRAVRHVVFDTNFWKTFAWNRLTTAPGDPGSLTIFGQSPSAHRLLAQHLVSEYRVSVEARGRRLDEWKRRPEYPDNHWWDCLVGCSVAASMVGASLATRKPANAPAQSNDKPKRMSYAEFIASRKG